MRPTVEARRASSERMPNAGHSKHQLPFDAILEPVCESMNRPETRGHVTAFEYEGL